METMAQPLGGQGLSLEWVDDVRIGRMEDMGPEEYRGLEAYCVSDSGCNTSPNPISTFSFTGISPRRAINSTRTPTPLHQLFTFQLLEQRPETQLRHHLDLLRRINPIHPIKNLPLNVFNSRLAITPQGASVSFLSGKAFLWLISSKMYRVNACYFSVKPFSDITQTAAYSLNKSSTSPA